MKYPQILIWFFIISGIGFACKTQTSSEFPWWEKQAGFVFQYDPADSRSNPILETKLVSNGNQFCLQTEEGPNLFASLCVSSEDNQSVTYLSQAYTAWQKESLIPELQIGLSDGSLAQVGTYKKSNLLKRIESVSFAILGEEKIFSQTNIAETWDRFWHSRKIHKRSFSLLFTKEGKEVLILPDLGKEEIYLVIEFPSYESIETIQNRIQNKNQSALSSCSSDLPEISEVFGETDSEIGRWIEIHNPNPFPICENGLELELLGIRSPLPETVGFISPFETRVLGEKDSSLERLFLSGIRWADLKKIGKLKLLRGGSTKDFLLPGGGYRFGNESLSWTEHGFSDCSSLSEGAELEIYCMNPGYTPGNIRISGSVPACEPEYFRLEELNPIGLRQDSVLKTDWKYIDLIYSGEKSCDPRYLQIQWGGIQQPISILRYLEKDQILTIGALPFLLGNSHFSYRNLSKGKLGDPISISDRITGFGKILWDGKFETAYGIPNRIVLEKTDANSVSIIFQNGKIGLHPKHISPSSLNVLVQNPRTSPGERSESIEDSEKLALFSEVSWMGSYRETEPISKDRFVETVVKVGNPSSALLEISNSNGSFVSILFPLEENINLLSAGVSTCFPESFFWKDSSFTLPSTGQTILKLYDPSTGNLWDQFVYNSGGPGINDTRNKIRKSASVKEEGGTRIWETSVYTGKPFRLSSCPMTEAHPGEY